MGNEQSNPKKTSRCSLDRPPIEGRARSASGTPQVTVARIEEGENTPNLLEVSRRLSSCELTPTRLERRPSRGKVSLTGENPYLMGQSPSRRGSRAGHIEGVAKGVTTLMEQVKLSQYQCQLLRQTWAKLRSNHDVFTQVFKVLSYKSPTSREIFQKMSIVDGFKGHSHCDLNAHIRYLVELLDTLVGELHQPAKAAEECHIANPEVEPCRCRSRSRLLAYTDCCCIGPATHELPEYFSSNLRILILLNVSIPSIFADSFDKFPFLEEIDISSSDSLRSFDLSSLRNAPFLKKLHISGCPNLQFINGTLLENNLVLQSVVLRNNGLREVPKIVMTDNHTNNLELDLSQNHIEYLEEGAFRGIRARWIVIAQNQLIAVKAHVFTNSSIHSLDMSDNPDLVSISKKAFSGIVQLNNLDLSRTSISDLPADGLSTVTTLFLKEVESLKRLPPILAFTNLKKAHFTYPHHCCLFTHVEKRDMYRNNSRELNQRICEERREQARQKRQIASIGGSAWNSSSQWFAEKFADIENRTMEEFEEDPPPFSKDELGIQDCLGDKEMENIKAFFHDVKCFPEADAMNPCENIVGYPLLRYMIWFIWTLSIFFNAVVWVMLAMAYETRLRSHYLFMFNLSFANALTAIYLGFLAVQDQLTSDEYYRFAVDWQTGVGCQAAGFLCVFSSLLSILSMFFIAFEIAYTTKQSIYGRHLSFSISISCVVFSYVFSFSMAVLPLLGISSYSKTSTCLPLHVESRIDQTYVIFGLSVVVSAFLGMVFCYASIFRVLLDPSTPSRPEDTHIIVKMLLLIVTDLICWMPSAFLGLAAAVGFPLISLSVAKIFIVCFFPVNTFTNPFLYVFLTKVIQKKVKKRALPVLRRIAHTPAHTLNSLSNLYHPHAPGEKGKRYRNAVGGPLTEEESRLLESRPPTLSVNTQCTSLTPRGSNSSNDTFHAQNSRRSSPRVSFQAESGSLVGDHGGRRRSLGILKKVSDLSEHSSESHYEHFPHASVVEHVDLPLLSSLQSEGRASVHRLPRPEGDSGRGSLSSITTRTHSSFHSSPSESGEDFVQHDEDTPPFDLPDRTRFSQTPPLEAFNHLS